MICKKGVHFNKGNKEDKIILDYIEKNNINFSALTKQLLMQYISDQIITKSEVEKIARSVTQEMIESTITSEAFQNEIRKVLLETLSENNKINK
ncbi:hypothetical protein [Clostridium tyrobutyricum]|uniref:hypothetical protein n=1 Tax=Clostridium tyrobutyricum TaxID=1519 RepID=UPI000E99C6D2|nr:hypothetical protein [Clostridium tyrobutyricum]HBF76924.1 hypothetical protein [Clostridiaceae bacterium]